MLTVSPTKAGLLCATPAGIDLYDIQAYARRHLPRAVPWISEDRGLKTTSVTRGQIASGNVTDLVMETA